jgi:cyclopropane-fatty-acyl-phospholipid synthase
MWGEGLLSKARKAGERVVGAAVGHGLERLADAVRKAGGEALDIVMPDGTRVSFGLAPRVVLSIRDHAALAALARPSLASLGEAYVEGDIDIDGDIGEVIAIAERLASAGGAGAAAREALATAKHSKRQDRADIRHHYDVGNDFYALWLDRSMVYSCAYYRHEDDSLEQAQEAKLDHICRKLRLAPGERLLDIGCGWGGLVLHAARKYGVQAVGITLSDNQHALASERLREAGLQDRVQVLLLDYRDVVERFGAGSFDKVSSIGMFEHVGLANLPRYFGCAFAALRDRGLFLNHGITSADVENRPVGSGAGDFIDRYVFPNGELPHVALAVREMSAQGFEATDVESLRPHYARTLAQWSGRLEAKLAAAREFVDERTLRVWRAYLAGCSYAFAQGWINIYQVLASKQAAPGPTSLPLTRDWIYAR